MNANLNRGDTAWVATAGTVSVSHPCPVCFGKLKVVLEMGNGERVELPCDYCAKGYSSPTGAINEYEYVSAAKLFIVHQVRIEDGPGGRNVEYITADGYVYHSEDVFSSQAEAEARAKELAIQHQEEIMVRRENCKKNNLKSYAWNAGYHLREAKECRRRMEYHEKSAVICRQHSKAEKGLT